ncbi:Rv1355c family protein [Rhodococcus sp. NPDC058514]|uniref:Rv1355c family protein n=1 Tax=unclassified Rhodococcus (in: high G+C Gram-positive bacteria) TaxID=192944 RepID=UPI00364FEDA4
MEVPRQQYAATLLADGCGEDADLLASLRASPGVAFHDELGTQRECIESIHSAPESVDRDEPPVWAYYPWRRSAVRILGPVGFRLLRLDRNRNKITRAEQARLAELEVGIVGLSAGHAVALALAMEGTCGALRLADFDVVELSNLNRVPATVFDLGVNKAIVAARRIAEIDPYLTVSVQTSGVDTDTLDEFLRGLDLVIEECDSLDVKVAVRVEARARRIPVLMQTSDRGLIDVERYDREPDRPLFHGLLGDSDGASLAGLSVREKVAPALRILGAADISSRMAASLVELGSTLSTWPQLGGDVLLGGGAMAAAVRRFGLGNPLPSGRVRIDLDDSLDALRAPTLTVLGCEEPSCAPPATSSTSAPPDDAVAAVAHAVTRAPSGGNSQPWRVRADAGGLRLYIDPDRTTAMDVNLRASFVALGAALYNARVAAAAHHKLGPIELFCDDDDEPNLVAGMTFGNGSDDDLARRYDGMLRRGTNRRGGTPKHLDDATVLALGGAARVEGARLSVVTERPGISAAADLFAASDRVRFLDPRLHREMIGELSGPEGRSDTGIDIRSLELDTAGLAMLHIVSRPDVMAHLAEWGLGNALGNITRARVGSSSALAAVVVGGCAPRDFLRGGGAAESVWIRAEEHGLAVQPISPVFLYGVDAADLQELAPAYAEELSEGRHAVRDLFGVAQGEAIALILRLSHARRASIRSRRRPAFVPAAGRAKG